MAKILIVDDEPRIRELIREHLEHEGFQCEEATDGSAALAALAAACDEGRVEEYQPNPMAGVAEALERL